MIASWRRDFCVGRWAPIARIRYIWNSRRRITPAWSPSDDQCPVVGSGISAALSRTYSALHSHSARIITQIGLTSATRLGVYEVTAPIGEGGMGQVFRACDTKLNRDVALIRRRAVQLPLRYIFPSKHLLCYVECCVSGVFPFGLNHEQPQSHTVRRTNF